MVWEFVGEGKTRRAEERTTLALAAVVHGPSIPPLAGTAHEINSVEWKGRPDRSTTRQGLVKSNASRRVGQRGTGTAGERPQNRPAEWDPKQVESKFLEEAAIELRASRNKRMPKKINDLASTLATRARRTHLERQERYRALSAATFDTTPSAPRSTLASPPLASTRPSTKPPSPTLPTAWGSDLVQPLKSGLRPLSGAAVSPRTSPGGDSPAAGTAAAAAAAAFAAAGGAATPPRLRLRALAGKIVSEIKAKKRVHHLIAHLPSTEDLVGHGGVFASTSDKVPFHVLIERCVASRGPPRCCAVLLAESTNHHVLFPAPQVLKSIEDKREQLAANHAQAYADPSAGHARHMHILHAVAERQTSLAVQRMTKPKSTVLCPPGESPAPLPRRESGDEGADELVGLVPKQQNVVLMKAMRRKRCEQWLRHLILAAQTDHLHRSFKVIKLFRDAFSNSLIYTRIWLKRRARTVVQRFFRALTSDQVTILCGVFHQGFTTYKKSVVMIQRSLRGAVVRSDADSCCGGSSPRKLGSAQAAPRACASRALSDGN